MKTQAKEEWKVKSAPESVTCNICTICQDHSALIMFILFDACNQMLAYKEVLLYTENKSPIQFAQRVAQNQMLAF